jgi:zinc transport system substrate-binding protein
MKEALSLYVACLVLCAACAQAPSVDTDALLNVLVSIPPQKNFVEAVGGDLVAVHVLIPPGASPATYDPKPGDLVRVEEADVFFRIGHIGFEQAYLSRIRSLNPDMRVVDTSQGIELRYFGEAESHAHEHDGEEHGHLEGVDPHVWLSPPAAKLQVEAIARVLAEMDPEHADTFRANALDYAARLDALHAELAALFAGLEARTILVFHPAWGYFTDAYGLKQLAIEQSGKAPTAEQLRHIIDTAKASGIEVIFVQAQFSREVAGSVAREIGGVVVSIDPLAEDYIGNLRSVGKTVHEHLQR